MATEIILDQGEVAELPKPVHSAFTPLVGRTDEVVGTGQELIVFTVGKAGIRLLPYGSVFHDYSYQSNIPIFELPDGSFTDWHEEKTPETPEKEEE